MPTTRNGKESFSEDQTEQSGTAQSEQQPADSTAAPASASSAAGAPASASSAAGAPASASSDADAQPEGNFQSPPPAQSGGTDRAAASDSGRNFSHYNTPAHRTARRAARMSEADYEALHLHPDQEYIARSLQERMDAVQTEQQQLSRHRELEAALQRQNEISGRPAGGERRDSSPRDRPSKIPRTLEFPTVPSHTMFKGTTDTRQVSDFMADWQACSLYVAEEYKVAHLLTAISDAVRNNLAAALRTSKYNGGLGFLQPQLATVEVIRTWMEETYNRPDHLYRSICRWRDMRMRNDQSLEDFLRARDKMNNQLQRYGVLVDAQTSKSMLVSAVNENIRHDLMRERGWFDMTEQEMITSMKTKQLAISTAGRGSRNDGARSGGGQLYAATANAGKASRASKQQLMVATSERTPGGNVNNHGSRAPNRHQSFQREHYMYSMRDTPQPFQRSNYSRPGQRQSGPSSFSRPQGNISRDRNYNLRQQKTQRLGLAFQKQFYHPSQWSRRVDQNGRVRPTAQPWLPANKSLYSADQDRQGNKFCIMCQTRGHDLTTCAAAHAKWKKRQGQGRGA